jgi:hypothetical protein
MTIVRREHRAQLFTIVPNAIFLDDSLSMVASHGVSAATGLVNTSVPKGL